MSEGICPRICPGFCIPGLTGKADMGRYYGLDLRRRVIDAIEGGMSGRGAAARFSVAGGRAISFAGFVWRFSIAGFDSLGLRFNDRFSRRFDWSCSISIACGTRLDWAGGGRNCRSFRQCDRQVFFQSRHQFTALRDSPAPSGYEACKHACGDRSPIVAAVLPSPSWR